MSNSGLTDAARRTFLQAAPLCGAALIGSTAQSMLAAQTTSKRQQAGDNPVGDKQTMKTPVYETTLYGTHRSWSVPATRTLFSISIRTMGPCQWITLCGC